MYKYIYTHTPKKDFFALSAMFCLKVDSVSAALLPIFSLEE